MIIVIIAGGSGTRLWPLSTPNYPKHLLKVNGDSKSLLQNTYERAKRLTDSVYVVSEASHIEHVKKQLSDLPEDHFLVEPARRGTASCIAAALAYIEKRHDPDEPMASIAADHYIRDFNGFAHSFRLAESLSREHGRLVLVGVEPDHPATGFGYIEKGELLNDKQFIFNVASFKEKPEYNVARKYFESGNFLWNCSYFMGSVNTFKRIMEQYAPDMFANFRKLSAASPEQYEEAYLGLENIAVDYALIEKVEDLLVVPASFDWMDLGSFSDMHKAVIQDEEGNHITGRVETEEVENSYVHNNEDKPIAVIGLDNIVVVNTSSGILVARKDLSQRVGDISKRFQNFQK
jgi:mannose-1-phosphate guanylyltransferase/mannose-6-phosphate isomerase